jgi:predicted ATP-grasp superfamily ATP-dependent carboligase
MTGRVPAIVSTASDIAAVTIAQTLGPLGIPVHALSNVKHAPGFYSRYTTVRHRTPIGVGGSDVRDNVHEPDELLDYMLRHVERGVLFPGSDSNVRFLARHKQQLLDAGFHLCIPDEGVLLKALDKSDVALFAEEHGFAIPRTRIVDSAADLERIADELRFPVVLKGVFKKNHKLIKARDHLTGDYVAFLKGFAGKTDQVRAVAQEWIPGGSEAFAKLYVMCGHDGTVTATHQLRRLRVHTRRDGSQGDTLAARTERVPSLVDEWIPFFERLGWVGMASLECKQDPADGRYKLIEINPRPWAILKISVDCGVNVPLLYYRLAQGERVEPSTDFQQQRHYIRLVWGNHGIPEPAACLAMMWNGHIGMGEVLGLYWRLLLNARRLSVDVGRLRDPLPTLAALYFQGILNFKGWF